MKSLRRATSIGVVVLTVAALYYGCYLPFRRNVATRRLQASTLAALRTAIPAERARIVRANLEEIGAMKPPAAPDLELRMIEAANYRIIGEYRSAVTSYTSALQQDQRPEIYLNLGETHLAQGQRDEAIEAFWRAAEFDRRQLWRIDDPAIRAEVENRLGNK